MTRTIWWHLGMKFHREPWPGHSVGKARECAMCQEFVGVMVRHRDEIARANERDTWRVGFGNFGDAS